MPSEWTVDTLREHILSMMEREIETVRTEIAASKDAAHLALSSADRAVQKAEAAAERRFESVNEFRNTLADQQRSLMPRTEAEIRFEALQKRMEVTEQRVIAASSTSLGTRDGWGYAVGAVGVIVAIISAIVAFAR